MLSSLFQEAEDPPFRVSQGGTSGDPAYTSALSLTPKVNEVPFFNGRKRVF